MNVFTKLANTEIAEAANLGSPSKDEAALLRRKDILSRSTNGKGFRTPAKEPKVAADGTTRGQRKRAARAVANAKVSEARSPEFLHSAARRRLEA
ncbi:hypothetical protein [Mesorhizobium sp. M0146]|uniref:hypothetical protein n=1 Tax=unclassified Mesorhizobium TaxID=325217 RepID=UPI00333BD927